MKLTVAIVGRPNVGKSTLFNRLTKTKDALVADYSGLTRDRHYGEAKMGNRRFLVVDTGGFEPLVENGIMYQMAKQAEMAIMESDVVVFVVDGRGGITPQDKLIAHKLRLQNKPVFIAINKVEGVDPVIAQSDFYELGLDKLYPISSSHGDGIFRLFDDILRECNVGKTEEDDVERVTFAVVGRPNSGKSTLVNAILGEERVIAFDEAGTTRDSIHIDFQRNDQDYRIIDTAGIRRKGRVSDKIEKFSVLKAIQAMSDSQVVVLVLDAHLDISDQDATIIGYALDVGKSIVVVVNKWDNLDEEQRTKIKYELKTKLHFLDFAKTVFVSALYKKGINELIDAINQSYISAFTKLATPKLTRVLLEAVRRQPPSHKGQFRPKLRYAHQGGSTPPVIVIHGNSLDTVLRSYTKYLERAYRKVFNLEGTPLRIEYKNTDNPFEGKSKK